MVFVWGCSCAILRPLINNDDDDGVDILRTCVAVVVVCRHFCALVIDVNDPIGIFSPIFLLFYYSTVQYSSQFLLRISWWFELNILVVRTTSTLVLFD
jgi:hypothetical protein